MPVVAAAAAAVFSSAVTFATAVGTATLASVGLGSLATMGIASFTGSLLIGTVVGAVTIGATAMSIFSMARKPKAGAGSASPLAFKANPNAFLSYVAGGPLGVGGHQVFAQTAGKKNGYLSYVTALSAGGPVHSMQPFKANDVPVAFGEDGGSGAIGTYKKRMWQKFSAGAAVGVAALTMADVVGNRDTPGNNGGHPFEWTAQHTLPSIAHTFWTLLSDSDKYPSLPKPLWEVRGGPVYDPRKDSTFPGGNGPQRWNNRATWSTEGNQNPYLQALTFCLGHTFNGVRLGGVGVPISAIDVPAFVYAANVADANGWKIAWEWNTGMRKWDVLATMLQAGGGTPLVRGSKISCMVEAPRVSIGIITDEDIKGAFSVTGTANQRDRKNTIIPRCKSAAHKWTVQPFGAVTSQTYLNEDGAERPEEIEYEAIADNGDGGRQLRQIAAYDLANMREGLGGTLPLPMKFMKYRAGDCLTVNAPSTLLNGQKVVVLKREIDTRSRRVNLTVRSETDGKHDFALGRTAMAPPTPILTGIDPTVVQPPEPEAWKVEPGTVQGDGGSSPTIIISPADPDPDNPGGAHGDDAAATHVIVRYRRVMFDEDGEQLPNDPATGLPFEWAQEEFPAKSPTIELKGVQPLTVYDVEIAYRVRGIVGEFTPLGRITTGHLTATDLDPNAPVIKPIIDGLGQVPGILEQQWENAKNLLEEVIGRREIDRTDRVAAINRDTVIQNDLVQTRETLEIAVDGTLVLIENVQQVTLSAIAAETLTRQLQVSALGDQIAGVETTTTTTATALAAETLTRQLQYSQTQGAIAVIDTRSSTTASALAAETQTRTQQVSTINGNLATVDQIARTAATDLQTLSQTTTTLASSFNGFQALASGQITTLTNGQQALATDFSLLGATVAGNGSSIAALDTALATETSTRASADATLQSSFNGQLALVNTQLSTQADALATQSGLIVGLQSSFGGLNSTVQIQATAIAGLETQNNVAKFSLIAQAGGGQPARFGLTSTIYGSAISLDASKVWFGDSMFVEPISRTLQTLAVGGQRRVIGAGFGVGGALDEWRGPANIAVADMSIANSIWAVKSSDGKTYYGGTELGGGATPKAWGDFNTRIGTRTSAGRQSTSLVTVLSENVPNGIAVAWSKLSGDESWQITAANSAQTAFRAIVSTGGEINRGSFIGRVTDAVTGAWIADVIVSAAIIYNV